VAEPVNALVREEARASDVRVGADLPGARRELRPRRADERALDDAVVVARPASRPSVGEGLRDASVVVDEGRGADRVRDAVAVRLDCLLGELLLEEVEGRFRALAVGDVAERLAPAVRV
jgi:hypothetical protein